MTRISRFGTTANGYIALAGFVGLLLIVVGVGFGFSARRNPDPRDLSYWNKLAVSRDWYPAADQGDPQAQCLHGLSLIRSNFVIMMDRVPLLAAIPVIGKRYFEKTSYGIDETIGPELLAESHSWIERSANQGFAPAREAMKLFAGKTIRTKKDGGANESQVNSTSRP